jgi:hypothetical protein
MKTSSELVKYLEDRYTVDFSPQGECGAYTPFPEKDMTMGWYMHVYSSPTVDQWALGAVLAGLPDGCEIRFHVTDESLSVVCDTFDRRLECFREAFANLVD